MNVVSNGDVIRSPLKQLSFTGHLRFLNELRVGLNRRHHEILLVEEWHSKVVQLVGCHPLLNEVAWEDWLVLEIELYE